MGIALEMGADEALPVGQMATSGNAQIGPLGTQALERQKGDCVAVVDDCDFDAGLGESCVDQQVVIGAKERARKLSIVAL